MSALVVRGIGRLVTMVPAAGDPLGVIERAAAVIDEGRFAWVGPERDLPASFTEHVQSVNVFSAGGRLASPGLVEPHAHPMWAGSRAHEFALRARGATYEEIQQAGGGIRSTVRATTEAEDEELIASTLTRLDRLRAFGVTTCEAKSGYALTVDGELRLLHLLAEVARRGPTRLSPTLLAHVPPADLDAKARSAFVGEFIARAIPAAAAVSSGRALADSLDVFCDRGAFTVAETRLMLEAGRAAGLALRVHAEQLSHTGAARLAAEMGARSVEHLEELDPADIPLLAAAGTVCTLLPGAALTLRMKFPDARRLLDAGCTVAIGTDLNPGSCYSENLPLMMSLACTQMGMTVPETWQAVTTSAARALGRNDLGRVAARSPADLVLWNEEDPIELVQHLGSPRADRVFTSHQSPQSCSRP